MSVRHTSFSEVTLIKEFFTKTKIGKKLCSEHYQPYGWLCTNRNNTFLDKKYCRTCERNSKYPIIHCIKWWIDNTVIVRRINWVWFRTKRFQRIYASNLYALVLTIFMFENSSWIASCAIPIFHPQKDKHQYQYQKISALFCVNLTSTTSHPWCHDYQYVWILLQRSSAVLKFWIPTRQSWIKFMHDFDENIGQNPSLHHLPLF